MAYCDQDDILKLIKEAEVAELTFDDPSGDAEVDDDMVTEAIAKADAWIDTKLAKRYSVPLSPVPVIVKNASAAIAVWYLRGRRQDGIDDTTQEIYESYEKLFNSISSGKDDLPGVEEASDAEAGTSSVTGNIRAFTRETLSGF